MVIIEACLGLLTGRMLIWPPDHTVQVRLGKLPGLKSEEIDCS
jgi:hypothetical protein